MMAGKWFEELEPGMVIKHEVTRTVTETDNLLFTVLGHNDQPLHLDIEYAKKSPHGAIAVNSLWTLNLIGGISVRNTTMGTTMGNLGYDEIRFPNPVRIGDTIHGETHIVARRESKKYPNAGIVTFKDIGINQKDEIVVTAIRNGMVYKKPADDAAAQG
jgi:acyl dehydratase